MKRALLLLPALALLTAPVEAQSRREMTDRLDSVEARIGRMESASPAAEQMLTRIADLEFQLRELTGEMERLGFENRRLQQRVDALARDLDAALAGAPASRDGGYDDSYADTPGASREGPGQTQLSGRGPADLTGADIAIVDPSDPFARQRAEATGRLGATRAEPGADRPPPSPDETYNRARSRLLDGDFDGAREGFLAFTTNHGDDPRSAEAHYWLGETYYVRGEYADAADAYIGSLQRQPNGEKAPDALVRLAASLAGLGRTREACETLSRFNRQFPNAGADARERARRESVRAGCS